MYATIEADLEEHLHQHFRCSLVGFGADVAFLFLDGVAARTSDVEDCLPCGLAAAADDFPPLQRPTAILV